MHVSDLSGHLEVVVKGEQQLEAHQYECWKKGRWGGACHSCRTSIKIFHVLVNGQSWNPKPRKI